MFISLKTLFLKHKHLFYCIFREGDPHDFSNNSTAHTTWNFGIGPTYWPLSATSYSEVASQIDFVSIWKVRIGKELKGFINCLYDGLVFFKMVLQKIALISLIFCNEQVTPSFSPQNGALA